MKLSDIKDLIVEQLKPKSVLLAKPEQLNEASYARVKDKIEEQNIPFAMITAFRGGLKKKDNLKRQKELENYVSSRGFPFTKLPGSGYVEDPEEEGGEPVEVKENSILIWDEARPDAPRADDSTLFEVARELAQKYDQDSFIFGKPFKSDDEEVRMIVRLYDKSGGPIEEPWAGPWSSLKQVGDDEVFWSTIGSKKAQLAEMLELANAMKVESRDDAMRKQYVLDSVRSALKRLG